MPWCSGILIFVQPPSRPTCTSTLTAARGKTRCRPGISTALPHTKGTRKAHRRRTGRTREPRLPGAPPHSVTPPWLIFVAPGVSCVTRVSLEGDAPQPARGCPVEQNGGGAALGRLPALPPRPQPPHRTPVPPEGVSGDPPAARGLALQGDRGVHVQQHQVQPAAG